MLLDTNATLLPFRTGIALDAEVERLVPGAEIAVPSSVLAELDRLAARGVRHAAAARELAARRRRVEAEGRGDRAVVAAATALGAAVLTADRELARALLARGVDVLVPRDRARLSLRLGAAGAAPAPPARRRRRPNR